MQIDFGTLAADGIDFNNINLDDNIDFGGDIQLEGEGGEIDWGGINEDAAEIPPAEGINFDISLEESGIVVEGTGNDGGDATGSQALRILDNPETRNYFIDQLFEVTNEISNIVFNYLNCNIILLKILSLQLESFLKLRLYEFKSDNNKNLLSMSNMQESATLQLATLDSTQNMLDNVQVVLSEILDSKVQHLHNIKHSPR